MGTAIFFCMGIRNGVGSALQVYLALCAGFRNEIHMPFSQDAEL